jgi:hypothetical protein
MAFNFTNYIETTLVGAITNTDTTINVSSAAGFPTTAPFRAKLGDTPNFEFILVTAGAGTTTWTVTRGEEGSTAIAHGNGTKVSNPFSVGVFEDLFNHSFDFGTRGSRPSPGTLGRYYFDSDPGWYFFREDGTNWSAWGPHFSTTEPNDIIFSWLNPVSGGAVGFNWILDGGVFIQAPALAAAGEQVRVRYRKSTWDTPTTTPYQVTAAFIPLLDGVNTTSCGIVFGEESSGKLIFFRIAYNDTIVSKSNLVLSLDQYNSFSSFNVNYKQKSASTLGKNLCWLRMRDDGVDLTWSFSTDGKNFLTFHTAARNDFFTTGPDQIGYAVNTNNTTGSAGMLLLSWKKE